MIKKEQRFKSLEDFLKYLIKIIGTQFLKLDDNDRTKKIQIKLDGLNFEGKKMCLELYVKMNTIFSQPYYIFYCYNKVLEQKISQMKTVMIGSISHDLRTPLNGMMATLASIDLS